MQIKETDAVEIADAELDTVSAGARETRQSAKLKADQGRERTATAGPEAGVDFWIDDVSIQSTSG
ncbi:MAG: hypothetical protein AAGC81_16345 [Pseudomonadota bacterium]